MKKVLVMVGRRADYFVSSSQDQQHHFFCCAAAIHQSSSPVLTFLLRRWNPPSRARPETKDRDPRRISIFVYFLPALGHRIDGE
jgi:hypothetical protein